MQALEVLPEHLLLRVLRAWHDSLSTQLATLPRPMHPAALAAAYPSIDSARAVALPQLGPVPFRRALRAVAVLASARRIDTVTLEPPSRRHEGCDSDWQDPYDDPHACAQSDPARLNFAVRRLHRLSAVTALHLVGMSRTWVGSNDGAHGLSCIATMTHLRAVGFGSVKFSLLPALADCLASMKSLQKLSLCVCMVSILEGGDWGGAAALRHFTAVTALEAVSLTLQYKPITSWRTDAGSTAARAFQLLLDLEDKEVSVRKCEYSFSGRRPPAAMLRVLRATAPLLDGTRCDVNESGFGSFGAMDPEAQTGLWRALTAAPGKGCASVDAVVGCSRDVPRFLHGSITLGVPAALLGEVPGLRRLQFSVEAQTPDRAYILSLARQLHNMNSLECLGLRGFNLSGTAAPLLLRRLSGITSMRSLLMEGCCMGSGGGAALADALPSLPALQELDLHGNDLGEQGGAAVIAAISPAAAATLRMLKLGWNRIGAIGVAALAARLPEMTSLDTLCLEACSLFGAEGVGALRRSLERRGVRLTAMCSLNLNRNFLECSGAVELAGTLALLPNLSSLDASCNAIGAVGMRSLARRCLCLRNLCRCELGFNCVGDVGAAALACALRRRFKAGGECAQVCWLYVVDFDLSCNGIGDAGAIALKNVASSLSLSSASRCTDGKQPYANVHLEWNNMSPGVWHDISTQEAHRRRQRHRRGYAGLELRLGCEYRTGDDVPRDEMHMMMAA